MLAWGGNAPAMVWPALELAISDMGNWGLIVAIRFQLVRVGGDFVHGFGDLTLHTAGYIDRHTVLFLHAADIHLFHIQRPGAHDRSGRRSGEKRERHLLPAREEVVVEAAAPGKLLILAGDVVQVEWRALDLRDA